MTKMLYREDMEVAECDCEGCNHVPDSGEAMFLAQNCHPGYGLTASFVPSDNNGLLRLSCRICGQEVTCVQVPYSVSMINMELQLATLN